MLANAFVDGCETFLNILLLLSHLSWSLTELAQLTLCHLSQAFSLFCFNGINILTDVHYLYLRFSKVNKHYFFARSLIIIIF